MIIDEIKNINSSKSELKKFGNTVGIIILVLGILLLFLSKRSYLYFISAGCFLTISGNLYPIILLPIHKIWMGLSVILGWISTRVLLGFLFYFVLTPIKFTAKIFGKEFLDLKSHNEQETYWKYRERKEYLSEDSERQF